MTLDASAYCPGGTGKKIKHCMCRDIGNDLTTIMRALEGNQRVAAMDRINRVLATKANRPCLLSLKILTLLDMNDLQSLEETVTTFVKVAPDNALAHTFAALLEVRKNHPRIAVDHVQAAISLAEKSFPGELYDAIGAVAQALAADNQYLAARGHLLFRAMIGGQEEDAMRPLLSISAAGGVPALLKRDLIFGMAPDSVAWKQRFDETAGLCARGAWKVALELLEKLNQEYPGEPDILKNIATARSYLGYLGSAEAWHAYAALESIDFADAVKAEATAQLLEHESTRKTVGVVKLTLNVNDANAMQEALLSSRQVVFHPTDRAEFQQEDAPPPKAVFQLLDRPALANDAELTPEAVPRTLGRMLLFGKETDREARLELVLVKDEQFDVARRIISELAGDLLRDGGEQEEVLDTVAREVITAFPSLRFPDETGLAERKRLTNAVASAALLEHWPAWPVAALDDKTPREVAGDPAYRVRLTAALLVLEQLAEVNSWPADVNALRTQLGVPEPSMIDPAECDLSQLEPQDFRRVDAVKLTDDQLLKLYPQAVLYSARQAIEQLGAEVLRRESLDARVDKAAVAGGLARLADDPEEAVELYCRARSLAEKAGRSPAQWYLAELPLRLVLGDTAEVQHIMTTLQTRHIREPGVSQSLYNILVQFGILTPDGRLAQEPSEAVPSDATAAPAADQAIWTPDSAQTAGGQQGGSKLWVPGMD